MAGGDDREARPTRRSKLPQGPPAAGQDSKRGRTASGPVRGGRGGRIGRERGAASSASGGNLTIADPAIKEILSLVVKQTLKNTQDCRRIKADLFDCLQASRESAPFRAAEAEREEYMKNQANEDTRLELPPDPYQFLAFLDSLAAQDIGAANKKTLSEAAQELFDMEPEDIMHIIPSFWWEKAFDAKRVKLYVDLRMWRHRKVFLSSCKQLDMKHSLGQAPQGYVEERLSALVQQISPA